MWRNRFHAGGANDRATLSRKDIFRGYLMVFIQKRTPLERIRAKVLMEDHGYSTPCWIWQGCILHDGYGVVGVNWRQERVHRVAFSEAIGPIPEGYVIDHLCRVRSCTNPLHLEATTNRENILRGNGASAHHAKKTHCPKGHPYVGENLIIELNKGRKIRRCRKCRRKQT